MVCAFRKQREVNTGLSTCYLNSQSNPHPTMGLTCQLSRYRRGLVTWRCVSMRILILLGWASSFTLSSTHLGRQFIFSSQLVLGSVGLALTLILAFYWCSSLFWLEEQPRAIEKC